ncbi:MAG: GNAT family N-acetyltransferase [Candidatus Acidiferrales bacterium]
MSIHQIDPTKDPRWAELVEWHPKASVFHTVGWLQALRSTYGYEPVAYTTSAPTGDLKNGLVFCRIDSWLTGRRLVSLPFSDHCEPLCDSAEDVNFLISYLHNSLEHRGWKYLEVRPVDGNFGPTSGDNGFLAIGTYFLHTVDLRPALSEVFRGFDKNNVQRRIHRAQRASLVEKCGRSEDLLADFYALFTMTRGRHRLPPTPYTWFQNLIHFQNQALQIRVAYKDDTPVAAILTLRFRDVVYFKYGCSDARFNSLGATPWLLWNAIEAAKLSGANSFDMGRTEQRDVGLLAFKNHWVPKPKCLIYLKFPYTSSIDSVGGWRLDIAKRVFSYMPDKLLTITGRLIYRHIG